MKNPSIVSLRNEKDVKIINSFHATGVQARRRHHIVKLKLFVCGAEVVQTAQWMDKTVTVHGVICRLQ